MIHTLTYILHDVAPYINWIYFFHSWGFSPKFATIAQVHDCPGCRSTWLNGFSDDEKEKAQEAIKLFADATRLLNLFDDQYHTYAKFGIFEARSAVDDIIVCTPSGEKKLPCLRQQKVVHEGDPYLCLADFINPAGDRIGVFATTVDKDLEQLYRTDNYRHMMVQLLCDRLAEATAERMHEQIRKEYWGYSPNESWTPQELVNEPYSGIRPAVGYPSLPDQSIIFLLEEWLRFSSIGIHLTDIGVMIPHASVCGLIFAHPQARYFAVGKISKEQFADYVQRRHSTEDELRKYLYANLTH